MISELCVVPSPGICSREFLDESKWAGTNEGKRTQ